jgi:hypothetical protein
VSTEEIRNKNHRGTTEIGLSWETSVGRSRRTRRGNAGKSGFHVGKQLKCVCIVIHVTRPLLARTSAPNLTRHARTDFCSKLYRSWKFCLDFSCSNFRWNFCLIGNVKKRSVECTMICTELMLLNKYRIKKHKIRYFNWNRFSVELFKTQRDNKMIRNAVGKKGKNGVYLKEYG